MNKQLSIEEYENIFAKDENDVYLNLVLPSNKFLPELDLRGKRLIDLDRNTVLRVKSYAGILFEKVKKD